MPAVLVVDDEPLQREILKTILDSQGYETHTVGSGEEALQTLKRVRPAAILIDLMMKGMDGIELLEKVPRDPYPPSMIMMTAHGTIATAVEAVKKGAMDYLTKPLEKETLLLTLGRAVERTELLEENLRLRNELFGQFAMEGIVGKSERMQSVIEIVRKVAVSPVTTLIRGESGTGKELIARAVHYNSPRKSKPFTALNCAAIPENLFESELFGHEPGSFTGATTRKVGLFELSNEGTLFLDEIGDLPLSMQSKLLRAIQEKEIRRIGGKETIRTDVRIIAATNKDLEKELTAARFREDLYYRLSVVTVELPPLRDRLDDLPQLVDFFLERYSREYGKRITGVEPEAMSRLLKYHWPGNIRQLASVIERAVLLNDTGTITVRDISGELRGAQPHDVPGTIEIPDEGLDLEELEQDLIRKAMDKSGGVAVKAAKLLGMSYKAFLYRLEKIGQPPQKPGAS